MKLLGPDLLSHISKEFRKLSNDFPRGRAFSYPDSLRGWISHVTANVLPTTTAGGIAIDGGHLTFHDAEHVARVLALVQELIGGMDGEITAYETMFLVYAVYLHDIGNVLGRTGHEERISEVLTAIGSPNGFDAIETQTAMTIARVHGGRIGDSKDTISTLPPESAVWSKTVRPRLLAAILRLADELADDPARANRVQLATSTLPKEAEVYHQYAAHLHTQIPKPAARTIELKLDFFDPGLFLRKLGKGPDEVYLLTEILDRSLKCYQEARYCSRFTRPYLEFERVSVEITIFHPSGGNPLEQIRYVLAETGYPSTSQSVYDLSSELDKFRGNGRLTGELLAARLSSATAAKAPPEGERDG